jgi:NitT/TauT family transport system permease protein
MKTDDPSIKARSKTLMTAMILSGLLLWEVLAEFKVINPFYSSRPSVILLDFYQFLMSGELGKHLLITLKEALAGLFLGTVAGVVIGAVLGRVRWVADIFGPIITALYGIPKLALAPIFILWFGLGMESKIFISALLVFYLVFFSTFEGIRSVNADMVSAIRLMGANRFQIYQRVILPSCFPWILTGIRGGIGASLLGAIVGEYMGASAGLGWMVQYATTTYQIERVMSCLLVLLFMGLAFNKGLSFCEGRLLKWRPDHG